MSRHPARQLEARADDERLLVAGSCLVQRSPLLDGDVAQGRHLGEFVRYRGL